MIHLDSAAGNFEAPRLFVAPLVVKRVSARLFWHRGAEGDWRILAPDISLANDELSALGYVRIDHPDEGEPWLEILANFDGPGAGRVPLSAAEGLLGRPEPLVGQCLPGWPGGSRTISLLRTNAWLSRAS